MCAMKDLYKKTNDECVCEPMNNSLPAKLLSWYSVLMGAQSHTQKGTRTQKSRMFSFASCARHATDFVMQYGHKSQYIAPG